MTVQDCELRPIESIIIVGGGSSGWISACLLKKALGFRCSVTVIESPSIGPIGVGEATVPSIKREVFDALGIPESEWMPACQATYKLGIRFVDWAYTPGSSEDRAFYHLFGEVPEVDGVPLTHYWFRKKLRGCEGSLDHVIYPAAAICDHHRSPRRLDGETVEHYAYHFDANLVGNFLRDWAKTRGVKHVQATIVDVFTDKRGWVSGVRTDAGETYSGDLYIDCTGFRSLLLGRTLEEPFCDYSDRLICDRAVAVCLPHDNDEVSLAPFSTATALSAGWVWKIPLIHRTGNGYVYSSAFLSPEEAEDEFRRHLGSAAADVQVRHLRTRVGRHMRSWVNNVVAIGLAASFLEPLESTGIYFTYAALHQLIQNFPDRDMDRRLRDKFNERVAFMVDDVRDFLLLHYVTTSREDTAFWVHCRHELTVTDNLRETLDLYRAGVPVKVGYVGDQLYTQFDASFDRFWTNSNYTSVLYGMGWLPEREMPLLSYREQALAKADQLLAEIRYHARRLVEELPTQRDYLQSRMMLPRMQQPDRAPRNSWRGTWPGPPDRPGHRGSRRDTR